MVYSKEVILLAAGQVICAIEKAKEQKTLKVIEINLHEMLVESMCRFPYELRFGQVYDAFFTYLLTQPEDIQTIVKKNNLDILYSVLADLVESKDIERRSVKVWGYSPRVEYFSLRKELVKEGGAGYTLVRNKDEPLNYESGEV